MDIGEYKNCERIVNLKLVNNIWVSVKLIIESQVIDQYSQFTLNLCYSNLRYCWTQPTKLLL